MEKRTDSWSLLACVRWEAIHMPYLDSFFISLFAHALAFALSNLLSQCGMCHCSSSSVHTHPMHVCLWMLYGACWRREGKCTSCSDKDKKRASERENCHFIRLFAQHAFILTVTLALALFFSSILSSIAWAPCLKKSV